MCNTLFQSNEAITKIGLSQKLLAKKLSAVQFFYFIFIFRKKAMRDANIFRANATR